MKRSLLLRSSFFTTPALILCFSAILFTASPSLAQPLFRLGDPAPKQVIDVTDNLFAVLIADRNSSWVEGELVEVELLRELPVAPFGLGAVAGRQQSICRIRLKITRRLFGPEGPVDTIDLEEVLIEHYDLEEAARRPQVGDSVFARFRRQEATPWNCKDLQLPSHAERERIDRIKRLLETPDHGQAADEMLAGCGDRDVHFAAWCIEALTRNSRGEKLSINKSYKRIWSYATLPRVRTRLLQLLNDSKTSDRLYAAATDSLLEFDLSAAEKETFHQANCRRLRSFATNPRDPSEYNARGLLATFFSHVQQQETHAHRLDMVEILATLAASQAPEPQIIAFDWGTYLFHSKDDKLNEGILRLYLDNFPHDRQNDRLVLSYWTGLNDYMRFECAAKKRICDHGLEVYERHLPTASPAELQHMITRLQSFTEICRSNKVETARLEQWLKDLRGLSTSDDQRRQLEQMLRDLKITLPDEKAI